MAYPKNFLRLVMAGSLYANERWSTSLSLIPNFAGNPSAGPTEVPEAVIEAASDFIQSGRIYSFVRLDTIKLNLIGPDGKYVDPDDTVEHTFETPVAGGQSGTIPPQIALAATLRTGSRRGLANAGRIYIPGPTGNCDASGRLSETDAAAHAAHVADLINDLNVALDEFVVGVASNVRGGAMRAVERVEVGRVFDTIRSRRTSLPEDRVESLTPITP